MDVSGTSGFLAFLAFRIVFPLLHLGWIRKAIQDRLTKEQFVALCHEHEKQIKVRQAATPSSSSSPSADHGITGVLAVLPDGCRCAHGCWTRCCRASLSSRACLGGR